MEKDVHFTKMTMNAGKGQTMEWATAKIVDYSRPLGKRLCVGGMEEDRRKQYQYLEGDYAFLVKSISRVVGFCLVLDRFVFTRIIKFRGPCMKKKNGQQKIFIRV